MKKTDLIEIVPVAVCLLFAIAISLYHVSFEGYLGLSLKFWRSVWAISENGFSLALCVLVLIYSSGILNKLIKFVFIPYFALKLIYHLSCYSGIYLFSVDTWESIWSYVLVILFIVSLVYCLILIRKRHAS
jgi:hypothetical protein